MEYEMCLKDGTKISYFFAKMDSGLSLQIPTAKPKPVISPNLSSKELEPSYLEQMLGYGSKLVKYSQKDGKSSERLFHVDYYPLQLVYTSHSKQKTILFDQIVEIRMGQNTLSFQPKEPELEERSFSIIYLGHGKYKELNLIVPTVEKCVQWVIGLHILHTEKSQSVHDLVGLPTWLKNVWTTIDTSRVGKLNITQISMLFRKLNISYSRSELKSAFKVYIIH
jgi:hypothetical protein